MVFNEQNEIPSAAHITFGRQLRELHVYPAAPTMEGLPVVFEIHATHDSIVANGEFGTPRHAMKHHHTRQNTADPYRTSS